MSTSTSTIAHISTVAVYVDDQERALDFWTRQVGFEERRDESMGEQGRGIEVAPPGSESSLVIYAKAMMPDWTERKPSVVFRCTNVEAAYRAMSSNGVAFEGPPKK